MSEAKPTEAQLDAARRLGHLSAYLMLSKVYPPALASLPGWVPICLGHIVETTAQGASEGVESPLTPFALGLALGNLSAMVGLIRNPVEKLDASTAKAWLDEYFGTYIKTLSEKTGMPISQNDFAALPQTIVSAYLGCSLEERREFQRGLAVATDAEENMRKDELRTTTATPLYVELVLYWSEINSMGALPEVFKFLENRFADNPSTLGDFDRFRKIANRVGLSFREQLS